MISESKILTVSYGTFSCTLEGFDDSFSTMKAIAEYFKDLAAEDRYFGAEPPAPDAEMLTRIAEKEVRSRVQAQIGENGIVLRKSDEEGDKTPVLEQETAATTAPPIERAEAQTTGAEAPIAETPSAPEPAVAPPAAKAAPFVMGAAAEGTESVAAKLHRIRAAVSRAPLSAPAEVVEDENNQDLFAPIESAFQDIDTEEEVDIPVVETIVEVEAEIEVELQAPQSESLTETPDVPEDAQEDALDAAPEALAETAFDTVEPEEAESAEQEAVIAAALEEEEDESIETTMENSVEVSELDIEADAVSLETGAETQEAPDAFSSDDDESILAGVGAFMAQSEEESASHIETSTEEEPSALEAAPVDDTDISSILGAMAQDDVPAENAEAHEESPEDAQPEVALEEDTLAEDPSEEDLADLSKLDASEDTETESQVEETPVDEGVRTPKGTVSHVAARARARVIHVKKADLEEAVQNNTVEEFLDVSDEPAENVFTEAEEAPETLEGSVLSEEDEADLMAQLAAVVEEEPDLPDLDPLPEVTPYHSLSKRADEDNVNRLMEESNSKFADSEGTRRRSAISHLKAAVAATVADRKILGGSKPKNDETGAYRQDLADVVRPHRAERREGHKDDRPAPLVLVSEQRIDLHDGPAVRPRRIGKATPELRDVNEGLSEEGQADPKTAKHLAESKSFAEFAERVGAVELPDLLEAAAAYASFVEGKEHFTRPDIMRRALQFAEDQGVSREEGLRSFGLLLRQGKIEKVKRGQFKIAASTRFNPETRIAGE